MEIGGEILDSLARLWEHLDPAKNMNTQGFLDALNEVSVKVRDFILGLGDHFESFMANGGQDVLNAFGDMAMNIGEAFVRGIGVAVDALDGLMDHLDPANNDYTKGMLKAWENAFHSIGQMALDFVGLLESTLENGGQEIINSLGDLGMNIGKAIGVFVDEIAKTMSELFKHMDPATNKNSKDMLKSFDKLVDSVNDFVTAITKYFQKFMDSGGREFVKNLGDIVAIVLDLAAAVGSGIIDLITGFMNSWAGQALIEGAAKALEWFSDKLEGLKAVIEPLKDVFRDVVDFIVGIFEGDGEKVGRAFVSFVKNALKVGLELSKFMGEIGEALILGLIEGIKALPGLLWECIKFIFDLIVGAFKELFGIHSPSTVMADLGVNLIEGLIEGIKNMITSVVDALGKIKDAIFGWFEGILSSASENWNTLCEVTSGKWGEIKESITNFCQGTFDNVSEKWKEIKENVSEKCKEVFDDTKEKWTNIKDNVSETISKLKDDASEKYNKLKETLTDTMDKWRQNSEEKWNKVKEKTTDLVSKLKSDTEDKYNKFKETLTDTMDKWRQNSEDKWTKVKDKATELVSNLKSTVEDNYSKFKDNLTTTMETWRANSETKWNNVKSKTTELAENLKSTVEEKYNTMKDNLTNKLETLRQTSEDKWNNIKTKAGELVSNLKSDVENKYETLKNNLGSKMETLKSDMQTKWDNIKSKTSEIVNNLKSTVEEKYNTLKSNLGTKLEEVKSEASTKWENIKSTTNTKVQEVVSEATAKYGEIKSGFTTKMNEVKTALAPKWEELKTDAKTKASGFASKISEGLSDVKTKFTKPFEDAKKAIGNVISDIGRTFSNISWSLPKIKMPHVVVDNWVELLNGAISIPRFKLEWRKRGGIIDGITPLGFANGALQMGGEAGKEMIVPLEQTSFTSKIAQAIGQAVDNTLARQSNPYNQHYNVIDDNRDIVLKINDREFARCAISSINKLQRESGKTLLDI